MEWKRENINHATGYMACMSLEKWIYSAQFGEQRLYENTNRQYTPEMP